MIRLITLNTMRLTCCIFLVTLGCKGVEDKSHAQLASQAETSVAGYERNELGFIDLTSRLSQICYLEEVGSSSSKGINCKFASTQTIISTPCLNMEREQCIEIAAKACIRECSNYAANR